MNVESSVGIKRKLEDDEFSNNFFTSNKRCKRNLVDLPQAILNRIFGHLDYLSLWSIDRSLKEGEKLTASAWKVLKIKDSFNIQWTICGQEIYPDKWDYLVTLLLEKWIEINDGSFLDEETQRKFDAISKRFPIIGSLTSSATPIALKTHQTGDLILNGLLAMRENRSLPEIESFFQAAIQKGATRASLLFLKFSSHFWPSQTVSSFHSTLCRLAIESAKGGDCQMLLNLLSENFLREQKILMDEASHLLDRKNVSLPLQIEQLKNKVMGWNRIDALLQEILLPEAIDPPVWVLNNISWKIEEGISKDLDHFLDKIQEIIEKNIQLISVSDALFYLPKVKQNLLEQRVNQQHPLILKIEEICQNLKSSLSLIDFPEEIHLLLLDSLDPKSKLQFLQTHSYFFQQFANKKETAPSSLTFKELPWKSLEEKIALIKRYGPFLEKLDLSEEKTLSDEQFKEFMSVCPNLLKLNLSKCKKLTDAILSFLPKNLEELIFNDCKLLRSEEAIQKLPKSLKKISPFHPIIINNTQYLAGVNHLEITELFVEEFEIKDLPEGLLSLDVIHVEDIPDNFIPSLPKGLQELALSYSRITDADVQYLEENLHALESLRLIECDNTSASIPFLPRDLKKLDLSLSGSEITNEDIKHLPRRLQKLSLSAGITEIGIKDLPQDLEILQLKHLIRGTALQFLPKKLKELDCQLFLTEHQTFGDFPETLETLLIRRAMALTDGHIQSLPNNLRKLHLLNVKVTDSCFAYLPRGLKELRILSHDQLTKGFLKNLPQSLESLELFSPCFDMTSKDIQDLPKGLKILRISSRSSYSENCEFINTLKNTLKDLKQFETFKNFALLDPMRSGERISDRPSFRFVEK